jgi:hypothetical protein
LVAAPEEKVHDLQRYSTLQHVNGRYVALRRKTADFAANPVLEVNASSRPEGWVLYGLRLSVRVAA